jgi:dTDP-4-dehydrorhamnose 3,5-epimerase
MRRLETNLEGPILLQPDVHADSRGFFLETGRANVLAELGVPDTWLQDNHSRSARGVLRGMHLQPGMAKLVRCARGRILDVVVDLRPDSPSYRRWESFELDDRDHRQVYVPDGFAHGFCVVSESADVIYRCSAYWEPELEVGFRWDDPAVGIRWPDGIDFELSGRDANAPLLSHLEANA